MFGSASPGGVLDRAIDAEESQHKDFLRLVCHMNFSLQNLLTYFTHDTCVFGEQNHVEGYHELSSKTQIYFSMAVAKWDADFYIKVDDDVHINLG